MVHDLVPLHFPEWVQKRTRVDARREVPPHGGGVRRDLHELRVHRGGRRRDARRAGGAAARRPSGRRRLLAGGPARLARPPLRRSRWRRWSRARTSSTLVAALPAPGRRPRARGRGRQGLGRAAGARRPGSRAARLPRARRAARLVPRRLGVRLSRLASRGSGCRSSRRWRAASPASSRPIRRWTRRAGTRPFGSTRRARRRSRRGSSARSSSATGSSPRGLEHAREVHLARLRPGDARRVRGGGVIRVGVDVSPLRQTRAGTARRDRGPARPADAGDRARRARLRSAPGGSGRSSSTWPGTRCSCRGGREGSTCSTARATARPLGGPVPVVMTVHDLAVFRFPEAFGRWTRAYSRRTGAACSPRGAARARGLRVHEARGGRAARPARGAGARRAERRRAGVPAGRRGRDGRLRARRRHARAAQEPAAPRRGGPPARGRAARRGRRAAGATCRSTAPPCSARSPTTSSPASTAARAASPTRPSTRASGSRCSRRWPAALRWSRATGPGTAETGGRRGSARRPARARGDRRRDRGGGRASRGAAAARARARARLHLGAGGRAHGRGVPRGGRVIVVDADVLGRRRTGDETYVRELLRALPGVAPDLRARRGDPRPLARPAGDRAAPASRAQPGAADGLAPAAPAAAACAPSSPTSCT